MHAHTKPVVPATNSHATRSSKGKARTTIKTVKVHKFKAPRLSQRVPAAPEHISSPIPPPVVTPVDGGESSSEAGSSLDKYDNLMDGIKKMVQDTMSQVFAAQDEKEKEGNFATMEAARLAGQGTPPSLPVFVSPLVAAPRHILSCVGLGSDRIRSISSLSENSKLTTCQSSIARTSFGMPT